MANGLETKYVVTLNLLVRLADELQEDLALTSTTDYADEKMTSREQLWQLTATPVAEESVLLFTKVQTLNLGSALGEAYRSLRERAAAVADDADSRACSIAVNARMLRELLAEQESAWQGGRGR